MDLAILQSENIFPPDVDPALWLRYLKGARAFDDLWRQGFRCPNNGSGPRCRCDIPRDDICRYFRGVNDLAQKIGGATKTMIDGMD